MLFWVKINYQFEYRHHDQWNFMPIETYGIVEANTQFETIKIAEEYATECDGKNANHRNFAITSITTDEVENGSSGGRFVYFVIKREAKDEIKTNEQYLKSLCDVELGVALYIIQKEVNSILTPVQWTDFLRKERKSDAIT